MNDAAGPLPSAVRIREVGPRDGFQNEPERIATADKLRLIEMLGRTGLVRLELTSFVRPDVIPQLADGEAVLRGSSLPETVARCVLVPTPRGLDRAIELREHLDQVTVFLSASETHNRANVNRSVTESLAALDAMLPRVANAGLRAGAVISTSFGCPYEGAVAYTQVRELAERLAAAGAQELVFADTTGMGNPVQISAFFTRMREELGAGIELTAHFHNTRGQGLANVLAALQAGCESFESELRRAGRLPRAQGRDRQHRHRGPAVDAARDGCRDRRRPPAAARRGPRGPARAGPPPGLAHARRRAGELGAPDLMFETVLVANRVGRRSHRPPQPRDVLGLGLSVCAEAPLGPQRKPVFRM